MPAVFMAAIVVTAAIVTATAALTRAATLPACASARSRTVSGERATLRRPSSTSGIHMLAHAGLPLWLQSGRPACGPLPSDSACKGRVGIEHDWSSAKYGTRSRKQRKCRNCDRPVEPDREFLLRGVLHTQQVKTFALPKRKVTPPHYASTAQRHWLRCPSRCLTCPPTRRPPPRRWAPRGP